MAFIFNPIRHGGVKIDPPLCFFEIYFLCLQYIAVTFCKLVFQLLTTFTKKIKFVRFFFQLMRPLSKIVFQNCWFSGTCNTKSQNYKKRDIFFKIGHMHLKLGQMQDVRALFDEKKILKIPIFDVNTAIRKFRNFATFYRFSTPSELLKYCM